jgi:hypothetical protein
MKHNRAEQTAFKKFLSSLAVLPRELFQHKTATSH